MIEARVSERNPVDIVQKHARVCFDKFCGKTLVQLLPIIALCKRPRPKSESQHTDRAHQQPFAAS